MQDAFHDKDDILLKAVTGLEGGCVASGSTCGIVTGGALGIAMTFPNTSTTSAIPEKQAFDAVGEYVEWFRQRYGTIQCSERHRVNFHTISGQLRYFLSVPKMARCFSQAGHAINYLTRHPHHTGGENIIREPLVDGGGIHCARMVLQKVRERTGVGHDRLEALSYIFDGGIALKGGLCGAITGGVMALNLVHGLHLRRMGYLSVIRMFLLGHVNLVKKNPMGKADTFFIGKRLVAAFRERMGALECRHITDSDFRDATAFQRHMQTAARCRDAIALSADLASECIENN